MITGAGAVPVTAVESQQLVDLCRAPYNCTPGSDVTTALQTAINAANTANQDTTLYFSVPGVYPLNGSPQTGSALGYTYDGQILWPARAGTVEAITIRIKGTTGIPVGNTGVSNEPVASGGVVLQTNLASAAWMFDAIPATYAFGSINFTNIRAEFENLTLRSASTNPPNGAVNGTCLSALRFLDSCTIDTPSYYSLTTVPTGTLPAVIMPPYDNSSMIAQQGTMAIIGYAQGVEHSEHSIFENLLVEACAIGTIPTSRPGGGAINGHLSQYRRLLIQACPIGIQPGGPLTVEGAIDIGDNGGWPSAFNITSIVNDPNGYLYGKLRVHSWSQSEAVGFPVVGAANVKFEPIKGRPVEWPHDDFNRLATSMTYPFTVNAASIGVMANTHHVWQSVQGSMTLATYYGGASQAGSGVASQCVVYDSARAQCSRTITTEVTLGPTGYFFFIFASQVIAGANLGNNLNVSVDGGQVVISYQTATGVNTTIATSSAGVVAANTAYRIDVVVSNPIGGPYSITAFVNGTSVATGNLSGAEISAMVDTDLTDTRDGFGFYNDTGTVITYFGVGPN